MVNKGFIGGGDNDVRATAIRNVGQFDTTDLIPQAGAPLTPTTSDSRI